VKIRVISGTVIGILAVVCGLAGGPLLSVVLCACAFAAYDELLRAAGVIGSTPEKKIHPLSVAGFVAIPVHYVLITLTQTSGMENLPDDIVSRIMMSMVILLFLTQMSIYVLTFPKYRAEQVMAAFFCYLYGPVLLSYIYLARELKYGIFIYATIFFCSWICDTCAYFTGRFFGRHRLAPVLSPKKTVEGAIGGVAGSILLCVLTAQVISHYYPEEDLTVAFAIIGFAGSIISMIGDLAASAIKRNHGIKDYGTVIPGHGGIMDRFDSVIFIAPVIYYLAVFLLSAL